METSLLGGEGRGKRKSCFSVVFSFFSLLFLFPHVCHAAEEEGLDVAGGGGEGKKILQSQPGFFWLPVWEEMRHTGSTGFSRAKKTIKSRNLNLNVIFPWKSLRISASKFALP